jgi:hypothetical protein
MLVADLLRIPTSTAILPIFVNKIFYITLIVTPEKSHFLPMLVADLWLICFACSAVLTAIILYC